ncbi:ABC transporter permease [Cryptosporangium sp. NPDC048952]|uniref:ABC transporter permease n=1 Tax=Cryptosporangium sp. NPDC048952 TaxID=3363961 RepID=UPI0037238ACE
MRRWAAPACGVMIALALAEVLPRTGLFPSGSVPPLSSVLGELADLAGGSTLWTAVAQTCRTWAIGLVLAVVAGVVVGVVIGSVPWLRAATASTVEFLRPIPSVALIPAVILIVGTGFRSGVVLIVYAAFWQVLLEVLYGVQDVDPVAAQTARSYRFGVWDTVRHVVWPTTLPYAVTGIRLAASVALVLAITGELVIGTPGVGNLIATAQSGGAITTMYALVLVTGVLGALVNLVTRLVERRFLHWHPSVRRDLEAV